MTAFLRLNLLLECCVCAIVVCILLSENSISDSIQSDSCSSEISRRPNLLKEGIIKDGLSDPPNGNLFLNQILHTLIYITIFLPLKLFYNCVIYYAY